MKFGFRIPSINKRIAARTSLSRIVRHNLGVKAPRGMGWLTNPKKAAYNRVYNRTSKGCMVFLLPLLGLLMAMVLVVGCTTDCENCGPNGACVDGICSCDRGFEGVDCGFLIRDRLTGAHSVTDTCTSGISTYMIGVMGDTTSPYSFLMGNFSNSVIGIRAELDGNQLTIPQQTVQSQMSSVTVLGAGSITSTGMMLNYVFFDGTVADTCHCTTVRQ